MTGWRALTPSPLTGRQGDLCQAREVFGGLIKSTQLTPTHTDISGFFKTSPISPELSDQRPDALSASMGASAISYLVLIRGWTPWATHNYIFSMKKSYFVLF